MTLYEQSPVYNTFLLLHVKFNIDKHKMTLDSVHAKNELYLHWKDCVLILILTLTLAQFRAKLHENI